MPERTPFSSCHFWIWAGIPVSSSSAAWDWAAMASIREPESSPELFSPSAEDFFPEEEPAMAALAASTLPAMLCVESSESSPPAKASATLLSMGTLSFSRPATASMNDMFPLPEPWEGEAFVPLFFPTDTPVVPTTEPVIMPAASATLENWSMTLPRELFRFSKSTPFARISMYSCVSVKYPVREDRFTFSSSDKAFSISELPA